MLAHEPSLIDPLHELRSQMRGAVPPAESRPPDPSLRKGRPQGCRSSGQSPGLHSSAGGVPTSSLLPEDPLNPRMTAPSPDCCCRNGEVFGGQRVRERSQETQPTKGKESSQEPH